jgi:hypothetical protein
MHTICKQNGLAVLMVRIVDHAGVCIRPQMVGEILYSLFELTPDGSAIVAGHDRVPLAVDEVMFDELQVGGLWDLDVCGYNFRHEVEFVPGGRYSRNSSLYALVYELTSTSDERSVIDFTIRGRLP